MVYGLIRLLPFTFAFIGACIAGAFVYCSAYWGQVVLMVFGIVAFPPVMLGGWVLGKRLRWGAPRR